MNKRLIIFLVLLSAIAVSAQNDRKVAEIQTRYVEIAQKAHLCETDEDQGQYGDLVMNTLDINSRDHQWRAVGIYGQTYKFFYKGGDSEQHLYPDQLVLVKVQRQVSDRTYHEDYLFSDAGQLIFYYQKAEHDDQTPAERRVYFSGPRAIRIIEDGKTRDRLNVKDATTVKEITATAAKLRSVFKTSISF